MSKLAIASFALGDRVRPTSGPYSRIDFTVVAVKGDRISVEFAKLKLVFPAKLLKPTPKPKAKARANHPVPIAAVEFEAKAKAVPNHPKLSVGDRVAGIWDTEIAGTVTSIHPSGRVLVRWTETCEIEFFASALILLPPESTSEFILAESKAEVPKDGNGIDLAVGDRVTAAWSAGRNVYFGTIESFSGKTKIRAKGTWTEGRRACDQSTFAVDANQLIKVEKVPPEAEITVKIEPALLGAPFAEITITYLECEITQIEAEGCVAPVGCWIEEYTAFDGVSRHVRYNSRAPMFLGKRSGGMVRKSAIGKANSPEHQQAKNAIARRNRIQALRRQISLLGGG